MSYGEKWVGPAGFINIYEHKEDFEFVSLSKEDPTKGYFKIDKNKVLKDYHAKNLIVTTGSTLLAKRIAPGNSWAKGIGYLEVGTGIGTGTLQVPQIEDLAQAALRIPSIRKAIASWTFVDAAGLPVVYDTGAIEITTIFNEAEAVGALVEMGLWGGDASITIGSGYLYNYKVFPVWNKSNDTKLTIVWKLLF